MRMRMVLLALCAISAVSAAKAGPPHRFMLLLLEGPSFDAAGSHVAEYRDWVATLRREGREVTGDEILPPEVVLPSGRTAFGRERLAGYFVIGAADLAEAAAVGRRCPHLKHGGRIVVRPLGE